MPVVMGTAGHIDHGKTTLIRALTGVDCDRLVEEKRRGITIELGFAELRLPAAEKTGTAATPRSLSIIDVPGHERFVHTMVAGASGVDFALLVIAADEGVMPQTREHLDICSLLGISRGVVALTKIDVVDEELLALAQEDVAAFLRGSALEDAPIVPVSAQTGQGLDALLAALGRLEADLAPARSQDLLRIPVDRVFTLRGHGTVITGTMIAGSLALGDTVQVYPGTRLSKVRGLQSHGGKVEIALAGRRTAVNLPDLGVEDLRRGDVISRPGTLFPSTRWMARVTCLPSSPRALRHRAEFHLHHGSREQQARLFFSDRDKLLPGDSCLCEVRLPDPAVSVFGDRFVLRSFSPLRTVAGGVVLNPLGIPARRRDPDHEDHLALLRELAPLALSSSGRTAGDLERLVSAQLVCTRGAARGLSFDCLRALVNMDSRVLEKTLASLMTGQQAFCFDKTQRLYLAAVYARNLADACLKTVTAYHERHPEQQGIKRSELVSAWGRDLPPKLAHAVLEQLLKRGALTAREEYLRLGSHVAVFSEKTAPLGEALLTAYRQAVWAPPTINALAESLGGNRKEIAPLLASLRAAGQLVRVSEEFWYAAEHLAALEDAVRAWFRDHDRLDVADLKAITGLTRKHIIPLFEYFDARKLTRRVGDARTLHPGP